MASDPLVTKRRRAVTESKAAAERVAQGAPDGRYNVNPDLWPLLRPIEFVSVDPDNSRHHPERSIIDIANSYSRFGQQKPIITLADGRLVAGEGQWIAARDRLSWTHLAITVFKGSMEEAEQYGLMDNRTSEQSEWDYENLGQKLVRLRDAGVDISLLGWLPHEASTIMLAEWKPPPVVDMDQRHGTKYQVAFTESQWKLVQAWVRHVTQKAGEQVEVAAAVLDAISSALPPGERKVAAKTGAASSKVAP